MSTRSPEPYFGTVWLFFSAVWRSRSPVIQARQSPQDPGNRREKPSPDHVLCCAAIATMAVPTPAERRVMTRRLPGRRTKPRLQPGVYVLEPFGFPTGTRGLRRFHRTEKQVGANQAAAYIASRTQPLSEQGGRYNPGPSAQSGFSERNRAQRKHE